MTLMSGVTFFSHSLQVLLCIEIGQRELYKRAIVFFYVKSKRFFHHRKSQLFNFSLGSFGRLFLLDNMFNMTHDITCWLLEIIIIFLRIHVPFLEKNTKLS